VIWIETITSALRDETGKFAGIIGVSRDISERKRSEELREQIEHTIRHDLRSSAGSTVQIASLLCSDASLTEKQRKLLRVLSYSGKIMLGMLNDSLALYKIETGKYICTPSLQDCGKLVREVADLLCVLPDREQIEFSLFVDGRPLQQGEGVVCFAEPDLLRSALLNMLANAQEASSPGDMVRVSLFTGQSCRIEIRNHGAAPAAIRDRIFEKYATWGKPKGTGLGAYSAKKMIEAQGGDISLRASDEENETIVTIRLPAAAR